jgi:hypothetical protein
MCQSRIQLKKAPKTTLRVNSPSHMIAHFNGRFHQLAHNKKTKDVDSDGSITPYDMPLYKGTAKANKDTAKNTEEYQANLEAYLASCPESWMADPRSALRMLCVRCHVSGINWSVKWNPDRGCGEHHRIAHIKSHDPNTTPKANKKRHANQVQKTKQLERSPATPRSTLAMYLQPSPSKKSKPPPSPGGDDASGGPLAEANDVHGTTPPPLPLPSPPTLSRPSPDPPLSCPVRPLSLLVCAHWLLSQVYRRMRYNPRPRPLPGHEQGPSLERL